MAAKQREGKSVIPLTHWCAYRLTNKALQSTFSRKIQKKRRDWMKLQQSELTTLLFVSVCLLLFCFCLSFWSVQPATTSAQVCWSATWIACIASSPKSLWPHPSRHPTRCCTASRTWQRDWRYNHITVGLDSLITYTHTPNTHLLKPNGFYLLLLTFLLDIPCLITSHCLRWRGPITCQLWL